jgi:hypothetical protein
MALTQTEKHEWMNRIRDVLIERKQRVLGATPNILNTLKELSRKQAHEELGVTTVIEKLTEIKARWEEAKDRHEKDEKQIDSHAHEMRAAISRATESLEESLKGFINKRSELDTKYEETNAQFNTDVGLCHSELDEKLEVTSDQRYHSHGRGRNPEFELRSCTCAIQAKLEYEDPITYQTQILNDAIFEFESALRLTTTTKQANIVWGDVQQFLVEFEERVENAQEEEAHTEESREAGTTSVNN